MIRQRNPEAATAVARALRAVLLLTLGLLAACDVRRSIDHADGSKRAEGRLVIGTGLESGSWTYWYPNGEPREAGAFEDGRRIGRWTQWYPNGQKRSEGVRVWHPVLRASVRAGPWTFWHENGFRSAHGVYVAGRRAGYWDFSIDDGGLDGDRSGHYHEDVRVDL